jgi:hypothetical protein
MQRPAHKCLCFISSAGYLPQATLAIESAKRHNPGWPVVLLTDAGETKGGLVDVVVRPADLELPPELSIWGVVGRPRLMCLAVSGLKFNFAVFLDGDTFTYGDFWKMSKQAEDGASMLVIPHVLSPLPDDGKRPSMADLCFAGNYNSGVVAATPRAIDFLRWWDAQTAAHPRCEPHRHVFSEQGWLRFAPDFDHDAKIYRDPGYNVAYWNVCDRKVLCEDGRWTVDGELLKVFHFSGFDPSDSAGMSRHQDRHRLAEGDSRLEIFREYAALLSNV